MTEFRKLQAVFQTLSDYNRLRIVKAICDQECSVGEIVSMTRLSQPLVSHHLRVLKENDFLVTKRKGPFVFYSLRDAKILYALDLFLEIFRDSEIKVQRPFMFCSPNIMKKYHPK